MPKFEARCFLLAALSVAGCHWVADYEPGAGSVVWTDAARTDAPLADGRPSDARRDGAAAADAAAPCLADTPPLSEALARCACAGGALCPDGLPDVRDPEPDDCNALLYEETFADLPAGRWSTVNGQWRSRCGWLDQTDAHEPTLGEADRFAWARAGNTQLADGFYMVETRVQLGAIGNAERWSVSVVARYGAGSSGPHAYPDAFIACSLRVNHAEYVVEGPIVNADVRAEVRSAAGEDSGWPWDNPPAFDDSDGRVFVLQLWYQSRAPDPQQDVRQVRCRAYDLASGVGREAVYAVYSRPGTGVFVPTAPGSVGVRTHSRAASFDYVRVYRLVKQ